MFFVQSIVNVPTYCPRLSAEKLQLFWQIFQISVFSSNCAFFCGNLYNICFKKKQYFCAVKLKNGYNQLMKTIQLSNGIEMPLLGYGVFIVPPEEAERCVSDE